MKTSIDGRLFEWDDAKNKINKIKHGINFKTAARVFSDPYLIEEYDEEHSTDEDRWKIIGMVDDVLFVIYTNRDEKIRLISAREATEQERGRYYGNRILLLTKSAAAADGRGKS
ncbi:MAG: BrnT family toxin [Selenomonadaceae bacterium]|nr:BrnT family toxin [Selenomonadaceae bacterium]